jgi:hypothetical protein
MAGASHELTAQPAGHPTTAMPEGVYRHRVRPSLTADVAAKNKMFGAASR